MITTDDAPENHSEVAGFRELQRVRRFPMAIWWLPAWVRETTMTEVIRVRKHREQDLENVSGAKDHACSVDTVTAVGLRWNLQEVAIRR